jgi:hypothetical protein
LESVRVRGANNTLTALMPLLTMPRMRRNMDSMDAFF